MSIWWRRPIPAGHSLASPLCTRSMRKRRWNGPRVGPGPIALKTRVPPVFGGNRPLGLDVEKYFHGCRRLSLQATSLGLQWAATETETSEAFSVVDYSPAVHHAVAWLHWLHAIVCHPTFEPLPRSLGGEQVLFLTCKHQEKSARTAPCMGLPLAS